MNWIWLWPPTETGRFQLDNNNNNNNTRLKYSFATAINDEVACYLSAGRKLFIRLRPTLYHVDILLSFHSSSSLRNTPSKSNAGQYG